MRPEQLRKDMLRLQHLGGTRIATFPKRSIFRTRFYELIQNKISAKDYLRLRKELTGTATLRGTNETFDTTYDMVEAIGAMEVA